MRNQFSLGLPRELESVKVNIGSPVVQTNSHSIVWCTVTWLPNFLGWVDLLSYGAPLWPPKHRARALSTELQRTHGEWGHILGSYLTRVPHTARISNVKIILNGEKNESWLMERWNNQHVTSMGRMAFQSNYTNIINKIYIYIYISNIKH